MSAHPHFDARTGEMHNYAYKAGSSDIIYYIINRERKITKAETIRVPYCSFLHDFFITKDHALFYFCLSTLILIVFSKEIIASCGNQI